MNTTYLDWEKEFDTFARKQGIGGLARIVIKPFIGALIDKVALQTREELRKIISGMYKKENEYTKGLHIRHNEAITEILEALTSTNPSE